MFQTVFENRSSNMTNQTTEATNATQNSAQSRALRRTMATRNIGIQLSRNTVQTVMATMTTRMVTTTAPPGRWGCRCAGPGPFITAPGVRDVTEPIHRPPNDREGCLDPAAEGSLTAD
ncbi:hypothetical protein ACQEVS_13755 [Streptomyces sp. CA-181903]|uniref:hypothetical protein n=1 Tax=Streptomyces sp. CA-181903 TaxID=3240055 RepID=UPI003D8BD3D3